MHQKFTSSLLLSALILILSCSEDEPQKSCYDCNRVIQNLDKDGILFLRQEDDFRICDKTNEERIQYELDNSGTKSTSSGGTQEIFVTCELAKM